VEDMVSRWQGRRVFLTGHTGFKGGWLAVWLAARGAQIRGYALDPSTQPSFFEAARVVSEVEDIRGDVCDYAKIEASITEFAPEVVFHLAAQALVRHSYADPLGTYATNVMGTAHVLEAVRKTPSVRAVVCVTTDKCYENREWIWPYRETDALGGHDPYSSSKACAEIVSAAYRSSFFSASSGGTGVRLATARAGNVIGGGDWSVDRLVPDLIRGFLAKQPVLIRHPRAIRPWQHVLEPLYGYILLAEQLLAGDTQVASAFNFGPGSEAAWPVEQIADFLAKRWGGGAAWVRDAAAHPHEAATLKLDASKAGAELGWLPKLEMETSLEWTLDWYRAWECGADMFGKTMEQVNAYEKLVA
jgi:CDP-glucose 4,6-dehydratase